MHISLIKDALSPLLKLAIPFALTGIIQSSVFFFETLFLAHLSQDALAAGALAGWLFGTIAVIIFGTLSATNILISHKYGANDHQGISLVVRDGFLLALILAIPGFLLLWNISPIFLSLGQSPPVVLLAKTYLHALAWGILPNCIMFAFLELFMGLGRARIITIFTIMSVLLTIFFSYALIFGKFAFPALGIAGAGWGMMSSYWITTITLAIYILSSKKYITYFRHIFSLDKPLFLLELLRIGIPIGGMYCIEVGFFLVLTLIIGSLSSILLVASQITFQYLGLFIAVIFSIAQAITVRLGHLLGANKIQSAETTSYVGVCLSAAFMGIVALFYWFCPTMLIAIDFDIHNPKNLEIITYTKQFLMIGAIFQILEAIRIALFGALRGLKDTRFTLLTSIIGFWCISLPVGYFLAIYLQLSGKGFWWGMVLGAACSVFLLYLRFKSRIRLCYDAV